MSSYILFVLCFLARKPMSLAVAGEKRNPEAVHSPGRQVVMVFKSSLL